MPSFDLHFTTAVFYALTALVAWVPAASPANSPAAPQLVVRLALMRAALVVGLLCHGVALGYSLFGGDGLNIGFSHAISLIIWLVMGVYFLIGFDNQLLRLAALYLAPIAAAATLLPAFLPAQRIVHYAGFAFKLHFVVAILAYALFTVAALHALLMLFLEKRLHEGAMPQELQGMPPLLRIERLLFQLLGIAFLLLTATLVSGVFFSESLFGKAFQLSHKTVFAVFSWLIFGGLLFGHWKFGWRGKVAVRWTLIGFLLLLLSYVGSKFVLEIILHRI
ncbi:MAG: cytochrome c biogenesis protein CcsA [Betaproteobacteria bacterium]